MIVEGCFIGETVPTDIDRLDSIIGGDFPPGSLILLDGESRCWQDSFSAQFLYRGIIDYGENGVYVSITESREGIPEEHLVSSDEADFLNINCRYVHNFLG